MSAFCRCWCHSGYGEFMRHGLASYEPQTNAQARRQGAIETVRGKGRRCGSPKAKNLIPSGAIMMCTGRLGRPKRCHPARNSPLFDTVSVGWGRCRRQTSASSLSRAVGRLTLYHPWPALPDSQYLLALAQPPNHRTSPVGACPREFPDAVRHQ